MSKIRMLALLAVMVLSTPVLAQGTLPGPVVLGLYFDAEENVSETSIMTAASVEAYLIITEATAHEIAGWEVKVTLSGGAVVTDVALPVGSALTLAGPQDWGAALGEPLPANPRTKLATFTIFSDAEADVSIFLGAVDSPTAPGSLPGVQLGDGTWSLIGIVSGDPNQPVAGIDSTTPSEGTSWGELKSLFR